MEGVSVCRPGGCLTEIGSAIHDVADHYGFDTVTRWGRCVLSCACSLQPTRIESVRVIDRGCRCT